MCHCLAVGFFFSQPGKIERGTAACGWLCVCYIGNGEIYHSMHTCYVMHDDSILQGIESYGGNEV